MYIYIYIYRVAPRRRRRGAGVGRRALREAQKKIHKIYRKPQQNEKEINDKEITKRNKRVK